MAVFYSEYLGPIELYLLILSFFTAVPMVAIAILCFTIPQKRYRRLWQERLKYSLFLPLIALILSPSLITLQPGAALEIKPWNQTYYTAFQTLRSDDNYGDELLIQCHLSGLLCRSIYSHHTWNPFYGETMSSTNGDSFAINLTYRNEIDQLQVKLYSKNVVYIRSRNQEICNMGSPPRRDCEGHWIP